ncbi:MAG: PAS domain S-box protein [Thermodesulfobacteriota bacterium]
MVKHFCPITGLELYTRPEWQRHKIGSDYTVDFWVIGDSIIYTRPAGNVNLKTIKSSLLIDEAVASHVAGGTGRYIQIEDYSQLHSVSFDARKHFADYYANNRRVEAVFLCNLSPLMNLAIKIGKRFAFPGLTIFTGGYYRHAVEKALEICEARGLPKGTFVFNQPLKYREESKTLSPVALLTNPQWEIKTHDFTCQNVVIDQKILFSMPEGHLNARHIPLIHNVHTSVMQQADFDYIVEDASKMSGFTRKSLQLLVKYVLSLHRENPFRMYVISGANALIATAAKMTHPFTPFAIRTAGDINTAFEMIRQDQKNQHTAPKTQEEHPDSQIQRYIDDLLLFIGSINWEKEGIESEAGEFDPDHPFASIFNSIAIIKEELDDLTARRRENELTIRENEEKYSKLFLYSNDAIFINDLDGRILDVNNKAVEISGYSKSELLALNIHDLQARKSLESSHTALEAMKEDGFVNFEIECMKKNGERFSAEVSSNIFEIKGQKIVQMLMRDITQRKEAEAVLRNYRTLVETMNDGMAIVDPQLHIRYANKALCKMTGYHADEIIGRPAIDFLDEKNQQRLEAEISEWPQDDTHIFEIDLTGKDNQSISAIVSPTSIYNDEGEFTGFMGIVTDISDLNKARWEKDHLQAQLFHSQKMEAIGALAGGVAHDFNNYLTIILGCADLMQVKKDDRIKQEKYIQEIKNAAEHSAALTRQLLAFSRRQILEKTTININQVIANMGKMLRRLIGENIELQTTLAPELRQVHADPGQIEQIILNLAVNARDAMPDGGRLRIITENTVIDEFYRRRFPYAQAGDFVCMTFEDNGCGMKPDVVENIFEPFFSTKVAGQGTGLGLAVVYGVVKQHDGWIDVYSEPSHGSRFTIYLPVQTSLAGRAGEKKAASHKAAPSEYQGSGEWILVVEDQKEVREMIISVLEMNGYQVASADSIAAARKLNAEKKEGFSLLFSDVILSDGNGIDLAIAITADHPDTKVLLSSGYTEEKSRIDIIEKNRFHFLQKPYPIAAMLEKVSEALNHQ